MEIVKVNISWSGNNYVAGTDQVNGTVFTTSKNYDELIGEFESLFKFHIEGSLEDGDDLSDDLKKGRYRFEYVLMISAILHNLEDVVSLSALNKVTGINEKQLWHYKSGLRIPRQAQREKIIKGLHEIGESLLEVV